MTVTGVTFAGATQDALVTEAWTMGLTSSGALVNTSSIVVTFPAGFDLTGVTVGTAFDGIGVAGTTLLTGFTGAFVYQITCVSQVLTFSLYQIDFGSGDNLPAATPATFSVAGIKNPAAGSYPAAGFIVATPSVAGSPGSPSAPIVITGSAAPPSVTTQAASSVTLATATLNGIVSTNGANVTACSFKYGTDPTLATGTTTTVTTPSLPIADPAINQSVTLLLTGLTPYTKIYYRVIATNSEGTTNGSILSVVPHRTGALIDPIGIITTAVLHGCNWVTVNAALTRAYLSNYYGTDGTTPGSFAIVNISTPTSTTVVGSIVFPSSSPLDTPTAHVIVGQYAYVTNYNHLRINVVSIANEASPSIVGAVTSVEIAVGGGIATDGTYLYVLRPAGADMAIDKYGLGTPTAPNLVGSVTVTGVPNLSDVVYRAGLLFAPSADGYFFTFDAVTMTQLGSVHYGGTNPADANNVAVNATTAFVTDYGANRLYAIDITDPSTPTVISYVTVGVGPQSVYFADSLYVVVTNYSANTVSLVDITSPAAMVEVDTALAAFGMTSGDAPNHITGTNLNAYSANYGGFSMTSYSLTNVPSDSAGPVNQKAALTLGVGM